MGDIAWYVLRYLLLCCIDHHLTHASSEGYVFVLGPYNLVFLDADKENYPLYFDLIIDKLTTGGILLSDNVLWSGKVLSSATDEATTALQAYNQKINSDARVETIILPVRDGLTITRKC